jgi:hypothetical protein
MYTHKINLIDVGACCLSVYIYLNKKQLERNRVVIGSTCPTSFNHAPCAALTPLKNPCMQ